MSGQTPFYQGPGDKQLGIMATGMQGEQHWRSDLERAARQPSRLMTLPPAEPRPRPDGPALKVLRVVTYVLVIITCLAVLLSLVELYLFIDSVQTALQEWADSFSTQGLLGD